MRTNVIFFFKNDLVARLTADSSEINYGFIVKSDEYYDETLSFNIQWNSTENLSRFTQEVLLIDRYLKPGDVVEMDGPIKSKWIGYCESIDCYVTLKLLNTDKVIENVNSQHLINIEEFHLNSYVISESLCVGEIYGISYKVTLKSEDGSIFTIDNPNINHFIHKKTNNFFIKRSKCYLGEIFKMCPDSLDKAKFMYISNFMNIKLSLRRNCKKKYTVLFGFKWIKVHVLDVSVSSVSVDWHWQISKPGNLNNDPYPENIITGNDLKKLRALNATKLHKVNVGDQYRYTIKDTDNLLTVKQWRAKYINTFKRIIHTKPKCSKLSNNSFDNKITCDLHISQSSSANKILTEIKYPIQLMKAQHRNSIRKTKRYSIYKLKSYKIQKNTVSFDKKNEKFKVTTDSNVVTICYTKRFANVVWNDTALIRHKYICLKDGVKETLPTVDLKKLYKNNFRHIYPRTFVTRKYDLPSVYGFVTSIDIIKKEALVQWYKTYPKVCYEPISFKTTIVAESELILHSDFKFKFGKLVSSRISPAPGLGAYVGQQLSVGSNCKILVMWDNGKKTECWPQNLCALEYHDNLGIIQDDGNCEMKIYNNDSSYDIIEYECKRQYQDFYDASDDSDDDTQLYPILPKTYLLNLLTQVYSSITAFVKATKHVNENSAIKETNTNLPTSKTEDNNNSLNDNFNKFIHMIDAVHKSLDEKNKTENDDLLTDTLIDVSRSSLKDIALWVINCVRQVRRNVNDQNNHE